MARKGILPRRKRGRATLGSHTGQILGGTTIISSTTSHLLEPGSSSQYGPSSNTSHYGATLSMSAANRNRSRSLSPSEPPFHFANFKLPDIKSKMLQ